MKTKRWGNVWEEKVKHQGEVGIIHGTNSNMGRVLKQLEKDMEFISSWALPSIPLGGNILDCGTGPMARYAVGFSKLGYKVTGVDVSPTTIKLARGWAQKAGQKIDFVNANLVDLSKISGKFDFLFCIETFGHIPSYLSLKTLEQFNKKLKMGGHGFIQFWVDKEKPFMRLLYEFLYFSALKIKKMFTPVFHVNVSSYTSEEIEDMCKSTGFEILKNERGYYLLKKIRNI
ncbi:MAG: class I SAM-dependent methyltransferase [Nanoarchaeota archaeon]|nr:class I SAM-dependent methyltransferase [Nanoarchaeota archaeon]